ncbi:hypothetical protein BGZ46_009122 [Entomortierella lignicola]|nr:hypothetical protein BGZ46_009122 [Entomortierella lignicola]
MAYATVNETTLYIQGGTNAAAGGPTNQFFALDLTQSNWNTSNPPWRQLSTGSGSQFAPIDYSFSMTPINNLQDLLLWGSITGISTYDITGSSWSTIPMPAIATQKMNGLCAVTDPGTGLVYIPAGANQGLNMMQYNPATVGSQTLSIPTQFGNKSVTHYSAAWSTVRNSILMHGGFYQLNSNISSPNLYEYSMSTSTWTLLNTTGPSPGDLNGHCMVPAYGGTNIVVFGGKTISGQSQGSIYFLNASNLTWVKGADIDPTLNRNGMACSVSGDYFIAWGGGQGGKYVSSLGTIVIYNMKSNQWTSQFISPTSASGSGTSTGSTPTNVSNPNSSTSGTTSKAAIIGGASAAAVVVIVIALFIFKRYNTSKERKMRISSAAAENRPNSIDGPSKNIILQHISHQDNAYSKVPSYSQQESVASWDSRHSISGENPSLYHRPDSQLYQPPGIQLHQMSGYVYQAPIDQSYHPSYQSSSFPPPIPKLRPPNNPQQYHQMNTVVTKLRNPQEI